MPWEYAEGHNLILTPAVAQPYVNKEQRSRPIVYTKLETHS